MNDPKRKETSPTARDVRIQEAHTHMLSALSILEEVGEQAAASHLSLALIRSGGVDPGPMALD